MLGLLLEFFVVFLLAKHISQVAFDSGRNVWSWGLGAAGIIYGTYILSAFITGIIWFVLYNETPPTWLAMLIGVSLALTAYLLFYWYVNRLPNKTSDPGHKIHEIGRNQDQGNPNPPV